MPLKCTQLHALHRVRLPELNREIFLHRIFISKSPIIVIANIQYPRLQPSSLLFASVTIAKDARATHTTDGMKPI